MLYADVIIDISAPSLDRTFQYLVPEEWEREAVTGAPVLVPFGRGNSERKGYIVSLSERPKIDEERLKPLSRVCERGLAIEDSLVELAYWMKEHYGGTWNDALRTVIPVKAAVERREAREVAAKKGRQELLLAYEEAERKRHGAKARLLRQLAEQPVVPYEVVSGKMHCGAATVRSLEAAGYLAVQPKTRELRLGEGFRTVLNPEQEAAAAAVLEALGSPKTFLLFGVTGSGKTEVYLRVIAEVLARGEQAIVLIPEIALTYQTVMRFYRCFGDRVAFLHSRLSKGERYEISERAKRGEISVMIGPRSALFTPFPKLSLIVVDEEHEGSYKSESTPRYHARETAVQRAKMTGATVLLGSATPSLESYRRALSDEYCLLTLPHRAGGAALPKALIVDMRREFAERNRSIFSRPLREKMEERLEKGEQIMLFLNRRGYAGFLSCRSCGEALSCPHCDVSLTSHRDGTLRCHYCGYRARTPERCPSCGSPYLAGFGTGTQKIEELVKKEFPQARVLRMDADTTRTKDGYERLLNAFGDHKADVLIGTQMIVKGHDFGGVTLMGVLAADMSLFASDFRAAERTFQLLAQAAGRAGRESKPGEVVIQTYQPEHYAVAAAAEQDYLKFFREELSFRKALNYPPEGNLLAVLGASPDEALLTQEMKRLLEDVKAFAGERELTIRWMGPAAAGLRKTNDIYRQVIYGKHADYEALVAVKNRMEQRLLSGEIGRGCRVQFDFNPLTIY